MLNDIRVALAYVREVTGLQRVSLLGASFGGGICGYYAARRPAEIDRLVLLNPQLDYKQRTIDSRPYWHDDQLDDDIAQQHRPRPQRRQHGRGHRAVRRDRPFRAELAADGPLLAELDGEPVMIELDGPVILEHPMQPGTGS